MKKKVLIISLALSIFFLLSIFFFIVKSLVYNFKRMTTQTQIAIIVHDIMRGLKAYEDNNSEYPSNINNIISEYIKEAPPLILKSKGGSLINNWSNPIVIRYENQKDILVLSIISKIKENELVRDIRYDKNKKQWIDYGTMERQVKVEGNEK